MVVMANYSIEYRILSDCEFSINLNFQLCFAEDVIFLQGVQHLSFSGYMESIHDVLHLSDRVSIIY